MQVLIVGPPLTAGDAAMVHQVLTGHESHRTGALRPGTPPKPPGFAQSATPTPALPESLPTCLHRRSIAIMAPAIGQPAPAFTGTAVVDGEFKKISLSDFKGKYLVFFFYPLGE